MEMIVINTSSPSVQVAGRLQVAEALLGATDWPAAPERLAPRAPGSR